MSPARLTQVIQNLVNNAAKYTPAGGVIEVGVVRDGKQAVVTVRDNGIGISADDCSPCAADGAKRVRHHGLPE